MPPAASASSSDRARRDVAQLGQHQRPPAAERVLLAPRAGHGFQERGRLCEALLLPEELRPLREKAVERETAQGLASEVERVVHALRRLGGTALEEEARHPEACGVPEMERLPKLVGETTAGHDVWLGARTIAGLQEVDRAHPPHHAVEVGACGHRGEAIELVHDLAALGEPGRVLADEVLLHEALDEQRRIAEPARHGDRVCSERGAAGDLPGGERHPRRELREDGGSQRRVASRRAARTPLRAALSHAGRRHG